MRKLRFCKLRFCSVFSSSIEHILLSWRSCYFGIVSDHWLDEDEYIRLCDKLFCCCE
ncbi:hypothetical protein A2U01_0069728, partial [Trifolium medium]|nr:hypothetical protein [Trifolium medium]